MFKTIFAHMDSDPNAGKHMELGSIASIVCSLAAVAWTDSMLLFAVAFFVAPLIMGVAIEVYQRIIRYGGKQNTIKESILDAAVTTLWYLERFKGL